MKNQYQWKIKGFAKDVDANKAVKEFERIEKEFGTLTPKNIVEASRPKKALLYPLIFKIEDNEAAEKYRLQLARNIINNVEVQIISDSETHNIPVYEIITVEDDGRSYKHIETLTYNEIEQVRNATLASLTQLSHKLKIYKEFDKVLEHLQGAIEILST